MSVTKPYLNNRSVSRSMISRFGGLNKTNTIQENEFESMINMTSDFYPTLASREKRSKITLNYATNASCIGFNGEGLYYVNGSKLVFNNNEYEMNLSTSSTVVANRSIVVFGAYLIIIPDNKYFNTADGSSGSLENESKIVSMKNCKADGSDITYKYVQQYTSKEWLQPGMTWKLDENNQPIKNDDGSYVATVASSVSNGDYWLATNANENGDSYLYKMNRLIGWEFVGYQTYIKITYDDEEKAYRSNDTIRVFGTGIKDGDQEIVSSVSRVTRTVEEEEVTDLPYVIIKSTTLSENVTYGDDDTVGIKYMIPKVDFMTSMHGRLWACRYGDQNDTEGWVNEIYGSKAGTFDQFYSFRTVDGVQSAANSVIFSCANAGDFTGAVTYNDYAVFFRQNEMIMVYGSDASGYALSVVSGHGIQDGSSRSAIVVNNVLYYKASNAIYAYNGSTPVEISRNIGTNLGKNAIFGSYMNKIMCYMKVGSEHKLYVYDTDYDIWTEEDCVDEIKGFACLQGFTIFKMGSAIYGLGSESSLQGNNVVGVTMSAIPYKVQWEAVTGPIGLDLPDHKYVSKIMVRLWMNPGSHVMISAQYDSTGDYEQIYSYEGESLRSIDVPIKTRRCDHMRLKIEGEGLVKIYSITKSITNGSTKE